MHQAGSLVEPDRLRFDFTHFEAITPEQLAQVDQLVNDAILEGYPVVTEVLPIEEAKKKGAVAMFGEKYGDMVRVVEMGGVSMEFCGGTHLDNTAKVGAFRIKSEASVASGVRRIEATVGQLTLDTINRNQQVLFHAAQMFKTNPGELENRLEQQMNEMKELRHELEKFKARGLSGRGPELPACRQDGGRAEGHHRSAGRHGRCRHAQAWATSSGTRSPAWWRVLASVNDGKMTLPGRLRQGRRGQGREGRRYHQGHRRHLRRQGRRQARQRHGRRHARSARWMTHWPAVDDFVAGKL